MSFRQRPASARFRGYRGEYIIRPNQADACEADRTSQEIVPVGDYAIDSPAPENRQYDERPPVGGVDPPEVRALVRRDDAVKAQRRRPEKTDHQVSPFPPPLPNEVATSDLAEAREHEQRDRPADLSHTHLQLGSAQRPLQSLREDALDPIDFSKELPLLVAGQDRLPTPPTSCCCSTGSTSDRPRAARGSRRAASPPLVRKAAGVKGGLPVAESDFGGHPDRPPSDCGGGPFDGAGCLGGGGACPGG